MAARMSSPGPCIASTARVDTGSTGRSSASARPCTTGDRKAHAGEGARAATDGDRIELRLAQPGLGQQFIGPGQHQLRVAARGQFVALAHVAVHVHRDRTGLGAGFDREQLHGRASSVSAGLDCAAKKSCTSASTRVRGNGGRLSRNSLP